MRRTICLIFLIIFLVTLPAVFICRGVSFGDDLFEIEAKIESLKKENNMLEKKLVQKSSTAEVFSK